MGFHRTPSNRCVVSSASIRPRPAWKPPKELQLHCSFAPLGTGLSATCGPRARRASVCLTALMLPPFDIFKVEANGDVLWIRSAADLKSARLAVKELLASSPAHYVIHSHSTNNDLVVKPPTGKRKTKPVIFQIAYDEQLMATRAEVLKAHGFAVTSVVGNDAAKAALAAPRDYSLFMLGHSAKPKDRKEMADWLKEKYPKVPILALNPPYQKQLEPADFNVVLNGPEEWLFIVEASTA